VILPTLGTVSFKSNHVGPHFCPYFQGIYPDFQGFCQGFHRFCPDFYRFCPDFQEFFSDFHQIKTVGGVLAPPPPRPLPQTNIGNGTSSSGCFPMLKEICYSHVFLSQPFCSRTIASNCCMICHL